MQMMPGSNSHFSKNSLLFAQFATCSFTKYLLTPEAYAIKKTAFRSAVFLGEGIFTMGCSKNYIMYWGVLQEL